MNFYTKQTLPPVGASDVVCRLSILGFIIALPFFISGLLIGFGLFYLSYQASTVWGMVLSGLYILLLWVACKMLYHLLKAARTPANWLVRIGPGGILFKYRSYLHDDSPQEDPIAFNLSWHEITDAQLQKETHVTRDADGASTINRWFLNIKIDPRYVDSDKIQKAIVFENQRKPAHFIIQDLQHELFEARKSKAAKTEIERIKQAIVAEKKRYPGKNYSSYYHDRPITFVDPDTLRMEWSHITPGKKKLRQLLAKHTTMSGDQVQRFEADKKMQDSEYNTLLASHISRDETLEAIKLMRMQTNCSIVEAKTLIEKLRQANEVEGK
jgi:hypothetical protein